MAWFWRFFRAPGDDSIPLPLEESSWVTGRIVQMLDGHWDTIIHFAAEIDSEKAESLDMLAQSKESGDNAVARNELQDMVGFIEKIIQAIRSPDTEQLAPSENDPDAFENGIYADMLEAVKAVFEESLRLNQPFKAWLEFT